MPLLVDYKFPECIIRPVVSVLDESMPLDDTLGELIVHKKWHRPIQNTDYWTDDTLGKLIVHKQWYRPIQNTDYWTDDTLGELIVHRKGHRPSPMPLLVDYKFPECIIRPVVSVLDGSMPLLVDYKFPE
jgi:hypothetical protein